MADLARHIDLPVEFDFMAVSSYGASTQTSGVVRILKDLDEEIDGRHVLIVEDIIDSGLTLNYLMKSLNVRKPASLEIAALLLKEGIQRVPLDVKYVGFPIGPEFVVGYGLDYAGQVPQPALCGRHGGRGLRRFRFLAHVEKGFDYPGVSRSIDVSESSPEFVLRSQ